MLTWRLLLLLCSAAVAVPPYGAQVPLLERHGSARLSKGHFIILEARKGRPMRILVGKSPLQDAVSLPSLTQSWKSLTVEATAYDPGPEANGQDNAAATITGERAR